MLQASDSGNPTVMWDWLLYPPTCLYAESHMHGMWHYLLQSLVRGVGHGSSVVMAWRPS